jgi:LysM repeat protein
MQRDMKIGMAVGVALIGIVGALFFRREPETKDRDAPPPLQDTEDLDRRIGEKGKVPYMDRIEEFPDRAAPVPPPQHAAARPASKSANADAPRFLTNEEESRNREILSRKKAPAPDPIPPVPKKKDDAVASDAVPAENLQWVPDGPAVKKAVEPQRSVPAGSARTPGRTHVIQAGDTLSGLASKYLGSSARYREIYEANRNVLRSPDDLREGVTIVIPDGGKPRESQNVAGAAGTLNGAPAEVAGKKPGVPARPASGGSVKSDNTADASTTPPRNDGAPEKIRFVPVRGGPFSSGRAPSGASPRRQPPVPRADEMDADGR